MKLPRARLLLPLLVPMLMIASSQTGWTQPPPDPTELVPVTRRALHKCVENQKRMYEREECGRRNVELQRELDAAAGREQVLVAQGAQKDATIASLLRRPTWGQALTLFAVGLSAGLCTSAARGDERARVPCGVSSAATMALGFVLWRW